MVQQTKPAPGMSPYIRTQFYDPRNNRNLNSAVARHWQCKLGFHDFRRPLRFYTMYNLMVKVCKRCSLERCATEEDMYTEPKK